MSTLDRYNPRGLALSPSDARRVGRGLSRLEGQSALDIARIDHVAQMEATVVDGIAYVGQRAMQDVALLTQMEQQLAMAVPLATSRLQAIGDMTALCMTDVVGSAARRIGGW